METQAAQQGSKRNRGLLSCLECHRRKQKCDRLLPCNDCIQRGVPQKCKYKIPVSNHKTLSVGGAIKNTRLRRIIDGSDVILTPESIEDLQIPPPAGPRSMSDEKWLPYRFLELNKEVEPIGGRPFMYSTATRPVYPEDIVFGVDPWFLGGLDPFSSLPEVEGEPIPKSFLISYFVQRLAPWLSNYDDSLTATSPRVSWLPFALSHPPLFYATLLSAAVHLDRVQPFGDQRKLLWYKVETMRLTNERLSLPSEGATNEMILVALILLYFNVRGNNKEEYEIHLIGINSMLMARGVNKSGLNTLGMRGMVSNWLKICHGPWKRDWVYDQFTW